MSRPKQKWYVVWQGVDTGVFDSWEECQLQVEGYPGAKFKAFDSREKAIEAYRGGERADALAVIGAIAARKADSINLDAIPEIDRRGIAVDGACAGNPGRMEYRGVSLTDLTEAFHYGPVEQGTNNIAEFLAIVHALALLDRQGAVGVPVYSDSKVARGWVERGRCGTKLAPGPATAPLLGVIARAEAWLAAHPAHCPVRVWNTAEWGEIPADFGRK